MGNHYKKRFLPSDRQILSMRSEYPQFIAKKHGGQVEFIGELSVKPECPTYTVSIMYRGDKSPRVKILSPKLVDNPPHFYHSIGSLCLYKPKNYKWYKDRLISKDIVSWTAGWIYFYETWLEKGIWMGPEAEHDKIKKEE